MRVTKEEFVKGIRRLALRMRIQAERAKRESREEAKVAQAIEAELAAEAVIHPASNPLDPFDV
jgi:hypothetical protein